MKKLILKSPAACEMLSLTEDLFGHDRKLVVDGDVFGNYRVQAESSFTAAHGNAFGIPPAKNSPFAADGYWALITLTPGEHTLTFGGSFVPVPNQPPVFTTLVTYDLLVTN